MNILSIVLGIILLASGKGYCYSIPENVDKINLSRGIAVALAISKNVDLRVEVLNTTMSQIDAARSWGIYNPILNILANGGLTSTPGDPFFKTKTATTSIGVTQYLPTGGSFSATTQSGYTNASSQYSTSSSTDWQALVGLSFSQPLLKNSGKETMELSISLANNSLQDSYERLRSVITDTTLSVISSYNRLYSLNQTLESRVAALTSAQNFLDELNKRVQPAPQQKMELANAEFAIVQRRKDLVDAERNVRDQEASLRYMIGLEGKAKIIPTDPPSREEPQETEEQAIKTALELRPDLKQLQLTLKTAELQERVARHQSLPDLILNGSGGLSGTSSNFGKSFRQIGERPAQVWSAGLQFSAPLGNTAAENDYRRSKIRTEQVQYQLKALAWRIRNDVEADMRALISARLQIQMNDRSRQVAEQRLEEYRKNNQAGTATVQDVLNAENDLIFARNSLLDATETFANAVARLWRDSGVLLERQGIHLDSSNPNKILESNN